MTNLILLAGQSGSGKDTLVNTFGLAPVISHTTRKMRKGETNGVEHIFHPTMSKKMREEAVAYTLRGEDEYWALPSDLVGKNVYIIDVKGAFYLTNSVNREKLFCKHISLRLVLLKCPAWKRAFRMWRRGSSVPYVIKRLWIDRNYFANVEDLAYRGVEIVWINS